MRWSDEKYVKLYTRDTADWLCLSWRAQGLFCLLMRKCDGAGLVFLGRHGKKAVATLLGTGWCAEIEAALDELLEDGCVTFESPYLLIRNFTEAQEARASDKTRKQHEREMAKARAVAAARSESANPPESFNADVTRGHTESRAVTSCPTQTSSAQPRPEEREEEEARAKSETPPPTHLRWPEAFVVYRHALAAMCVTALPAGDVDWEGLEAETKRLTVDVACREVTRAVEAKRARKERIQHLSFFVACLKRAAAPVAPEAHDDPANKRNWVTA